MSNLGLNWSFRLFILVLFSEKEIYAQKHQKKEWNMFKINNKDPRTMFWCIFVNFEYILHLFVVFLLLSLSKWMFYGFSLVCKSLSDFFSFLLLNASYSFLSVLGSWNHRNYNQNTAWIFDSMYKFFWSSKANGCLFTQACSFTSYNIFIFWEWTF